MPTGLSLSSGTYQAYLPNAHLGWTLPFVMSEKVYFEKVLNANKHHT